MVRQAPFLLGPRHARSGQNAEPRNDPRRPDGFPRCRRTTAGDVRPGGAERIGLLDAWPAWASRSGLAPLVELARTTRVRRAETANTPARGLSNGRIESTNQKTRLIIRRAQGFRSTPALTVIRLCLADYARPPPGQS